MSCFAVCTDIGRNNAGTVSGAMNFCGQMGAFFLAIVFGQMVDATHHVNRPLYVGSGGFVYWLFIMAADRSQETTVGNYNLMVSGRYLAIRSS